MTSLRRPLAVCSAVALTAITALTSATAVTTSGAQTSVTAQDRAAPRPRVALRTAAHNVTLPSYRQNRVYLDLGVYVVAGDEPFEVRMNRAEDYETPIEGHFVTPGGDVALPPDLLQNFKGLPRFLHVEISNDEGDVVLDQRRRFCPTGGALRMRPDAPDVSNYPDSCPVNPFTLGAVLGIEEGFGVPAVNAFGPRPSRLEPGRYTATVTINATYADLLGLPDEATTRTVNLHVVRSDDGCVPGPGPTPSLGCKTSPDAGHTSTIPLTPSKNEPSRGSAAPPAGSLPDLRSLPASRIELGRKGFLKFGATVWNGGPSPLVVDGFRTSPDLMTAYQYFYEPDGTPAGHAVAGEMEWDGRDGHSHWHFKDFARYRLLDKDLNLVVRSRKEAFCLADTDAVDYTVTGANWQPLNTDLHTACGDHSSMSVREVLDSGSGDTYLQSLPGQSFNIRDLDNGVYYISVEANPKGNLFETDTTNNNSYRKIRLSGAGVNRKVTVPAVGMIDAP